MADYNRPMEATYALLTSEADYRAACDAVLGRAQRDVLIFDRDLGALRLEQKPRIELLSAFLAGDGLRRLRIVLHDPAPVERNAPRLIELLRRLAHRVEIRQSPDNLRSLADTHILADGNHGVRRFHVDQPRSALILDNRAEIQPWQLRFEELWDQSQPCLGQVTTGL